MIIERLRSATQIQHRRVEGALAGLMSPRLTLAHYRAVLERFLGFYRPWERNALRGGHVPRDVLRPRCKSHRIEADLRYLGADDADVQALPDAIELPPLRTPAEVIGSMYVLEGSTLGGQVISRHLESTLAFAGGLGYSFFRGYADQTGRMWASFRQMLASHSAPQHDDVIVDSARYTFDCIHDWMSAATASRPARPALEVPA